MNTNFSCSVPIRNCDFGLLPASNHAISSSRVSIGVMSTWSRAMRRFRRKGPRPYTAPAREGNWPMLRVQGPPRGRERRLRMISALALDQNTGFSPVPRTVPRHRHRPSVTASFSTLPMRTISLLIRSRKFVRRGGGEQPALLADFAAHLARVQDRQGPFADNPHDRLGQADRPDQAEPHVQIDV